MGKMKKESGGERTERARTLPVFLAGLLLAIGAAGSSLHPQDNPARSADYRIGPKDLLEIKVSEAPELNQTVRVAEDGSITIGLLGQIDVSGLTSRDLEKKLTSLLEKWVKNAHVTVFIKEYQKVTVLGGVGKPGNYELTGSTSILQVISLASGLTEQATKRAFIYRRDSEGRKTRLVVNLESLLNGDEAADIEIMPNDEVIIPVDQKLSVYVYGEVKTPGAIEFFESKKLSLLQAIARAGGTHEWASKTRVLIKRKDAVTGQERTLTVNLKKIERNESPDIALESGDIIIVR